ncbi:hypothetical protein [Rhodococcus aetherivorans]|uniref:hypothetical protein n=1 Tax=Rhodococcus aetherivorans TaxID=191292 RepID=UPI00241F925A|nr:hypothetical protein [Rhodococcus aetherivorans]WFS15174.1 hypothetical protein P9K37_09080 [Rhodococcus aetherivorans]
MDIDQTAITKTPRRALAGLRAGLWPIHKRGAVITAPADTPRKFYPECIRARTDQERGEAFLVYLERSVPYFAAVEERGGKPWFGSEDERRDLFLRRYSRPAPPAGMEPIKSLSDLEGGWH